MKNQGKVRNMDPRNNSFGELNQFLYSECYERLCEAVSEILGQLVSAVIHQNQVCIEVDEDRVWYVFRAFVEYDPEETENYLLTVLLTFGGCSWTLSVTDASRVNSEPNEVLSRSGVLTDQHLIPRLFNDEQREAEAERFLARYCPETLNTPMPVPIRSAMEKQMGLNVIANIRLTDGAYGQIMYGDGELPVVTDEEEEVRNLSFKRGDVLIDGDTVLLRGIGAMNCTLAHEAYHWFAHRAYVDFHQIIGKAVDSSYNGTSRYSSDDILEIQANAMAFRILMPQKTFKQKYSELAELDLHERISALADFFHVSYPAVTIRLSQLGLEAFNLPTETDLVTPADACNIYFSDENFRELVDTEQIIYTDRRYVYNRTEYVTTVWEDVPKYGCSGSPYQLTDYALSHPEEAFVRFRIDHRRVH